VQWPALEELRAIVFDFDGVFTDNGVYVFEDGREAVRCDRADGLGVEILQRVCKRAGIALELLVLSKEKNPVVQARAQKLGLDCIHATNDKLHALSSALTRDQPQADALAGVMYIGNDVNDLAVMRRSSFSVAPADAHPLVRQCATVVMPQRGGHGFVRAVIEQLLGMHSWPVERVEELFTDGVR
jgi:YrbI family 3-deoxy-D-manno-octulosonate 8-phosphate phosphatase